MPIRVGQKKGLDTITPLKGRNKAVSRGAEEKRTEGGGVLNESRQITGKPFSSPGILSGPVQRREKGKGCSERAKRKCIRDISVRGPYKSRGGKNGGLKEINLRVEPGLGNKET